MKYTHLLGKEYGVGASGPDRYDCWHLSRELLKEKYDLPKFEVENDEPSLLKEIIANNIDSVVEKIDHPEEECIVLFWIRGGYPTHIGVVTRENNEWWFVHILRKSRVTKERLYHPLWEKRIIGFYRIREKYGRVGS